MTSRRSRTRAEATKGPKRKAKQIKKAQEHRASLGLTPFEPEERRQATAEAATGSFGSVAQAVRDLRLDEARAMSCPGKQERTEMIADALVDHVPENRSRWESMNDGQLYCKLCNKYATDGHLASRGHMMRVEEDCLGTAMAGKALTTRRFEGDKCTGVATKSLLFDHWGDALQNLPLAAKEIHNKKGVIYIDGKDLGGGNFVLLLFLNTFSDVMEELWSIEYGFH